MNERSIFCHHPFVEGSNENMLDSHPKLYYNDHGKNYKISCVAYQLPGTEKGESV